VHAAGCRVHERANCCAGFHPRLWVARYCAVATCDLTSWSFACIAVVCARDVLCWAPSSFCWHGHRPFTSFRVLLSVQSRLPNIVHAALQRCKFGRHLAVVLQTMAAVSAHMRALMWVQPRVSSNHMSGGHHSLGVARAPARFTSHHPLQLNIQPANACAAGP